MLRNIIKENAPLIGIQFVTLAVIWIAAGPGPGICGGFILGAVIFGFWKERKEPGSLFGYANNWKRSLAATASMAALCIIAGIPILALAITFTPSAATDWGKALADYGISGKDMVYRMLLVGGLALGVFAFAHLVCTRLGLKIVAVMKWGRMKRL